MPHLAYNGINAEIIMDDSCNGGKRNNMGRRLKKKLCEFPEDVKDEIGYALHLAQGGKTHPNAKLFKLQGESGIYEIVSDFNTDTFRAVYAIKIDERLYVLHAFKKKSKSGIKTPKSEVDLIQKRLNDAKSLSKQFI